jgi:spermidine synthase
MRQPARHLFPVVLGIFFLSGFSGLVYQVAWVKTLTRSFGVTAFAVSAVLGAFFGGLALGSYLGGKLSDRRRDSLRLYGWLELAISLYALTLPFLFNSLSPIYRALYPLVENSPLLITAARFGLSFLLLILPTTLMGATLPLLVRALVREQDEFASRLSRLYALNTFGAVVGTLGTGYVLIGLFGLQTTTLIAALGNFVAGAVALALAAKTRTPNPLARASQRSTPSTTRPRDYSTTHRATLAVMFLSGFAALGYEVIWTRVFSVISDHSVYAFSAIVAVVLIGIALGSEWIGRNAKRIADPAQALALAEIILGLSAILSLPAIAVVARLFPTIETSFGPARMNGNPLFFFLVVLAVIIIPSLGMGATFPLAAQIYARRSDRMGTNVGEVYALNTIGATLGSIVVGFGLLPLAGAQRSMLIAALLNLIAALSLMSVRKQRRMAIGTGAAAVAVAASTWLAPNDLYRWLFASQYPAQTIVANYEDVEMTVTVTEYNSYNYIFLNGHHQAETLPLTLGLHRFIGHLPALVHNGPEEALVIGLGGGATSGAVAAQAQGRVDIVELSAGMVEAAKTFAPHNGGVLEDPRANIIIADGRNFLLLTDEEYDLITADIIPPLHAYSSLLYSFEYYQLLLAHLADGGLVSQWLDRRLEPHEQDILARTFVQAFPHSVRWQKGNYTILLGSNQPIEIDPAAIERRFTPQVAADLAPLGIADTQALLSGFGLADEALRADLGQGPILSDDHPYNEYFRLLRIGGLWRWLGDEE